MGRFAFHGCLMSLFQQGVDVGYGSLKHFRLFSTIDGYEIQLLTRSKLSGTVMATGGCDMCHLFQASRSSAHACVHFHAIRTQQSLDVKTECTMTLLVFTFIFPCSYRPHCANPALHVVPKDVVYLNHKPGLRTPVVLWHRFSTINHWRVGTSFLVLHVDNDTVVTPVRSLHLASLPHSSWKHRGLILVYSTTRSLWLPTSE